MPSLKLKVIIIIRKYLYLLFGTYDKLIGINRKGIFILCYHSVSDDGWFHGVNLGEFTKQLEYLDRNYHPATVEGIENMINGSSLLQKGSFIITFDDGYKDILQTKDIFQRLNIKPALFVLSNRQNANRTELDTNKSFLSKQEIIELKKSGWTIGCHSATHSNLTHLNTKQLIEEISNAKKDLEKELGFKIKYFAYPKGKYSPEVIRVIQEAGYALALSMDDGQINKSTKISAVPRIGINRTHSFAEFKVLASPSLIELRNFIKKSGLGRFIA